MGRAWDEARLDELRSMWGKMPVAEIADRLGTSRGRIYREAKLAGLGPSGARVGRRPKEGGAKLPSGGTMRRHVTPRNKKRLHLPDDHPAILEARTLFPSTVVHPSLAPRLLIGGENQRKIGRKVAKGRWSGMPIYTLTLEERRTCPSSCAVWADCCGNNMHFARRLTHGAALEKRLVLELEALANRHPGGFVVRLHILGDFYSAAYVQLWRDALERHPELHVFGFTAHPTSSEIGAAVMDMCLDFDRRCWIRHSGFDPGDRDLGGWSSLVIEDVAESRFVVCPAQLEQTDCCATCGLCWTMEKPIEFVRH